MESTTNNKRKNKNKATITIILGAVILAALSIFSFFVGRYPLTLNGLLQGDDMQWRVFLTLRASRGIIGCIGGFVLGIAGFVYQTVFKNPLASPDIIGVSSGASAGAAFGILFLSGTMSVTISAFAGAICCVILVLILSSLTYERDGKSIVLAGIAVHSLAQTALVCLKLTADPEKQLASIEYWIMGSLNGVSKDSLAIPFFVTCAGFIIMTLLYRQILILSINEDEAAALGVNVTVLRFIILMIATLIVSSIICVTGLISFIGLIAPHIARLLTRRNDRFTYISSGLAGAIIMTIADIFARSVSSSELPVSIFTSLLGAPLLIILLIKANKKEVV